MLDGVFILPPTRPNAIDSPGTRAPAQGAQPPFIRETQMGSVEFECSCGVQFINSTDDRRYVARFVPDQDNDAFWDLIDSAVEESGPTPLDKERAVMDLRASLFNNHPYVWQCHGCGIVYISDADGQLHAYSPIGNVPTNLLAGRGITLRRARHRTDPS